MKMRTRHYDWYIKWLPLLFLVVCFIGCNDSNEAEETPFDPNKPVTISGFTPQEGGYGTRMVLYGDNFGNDASKVKVTIGGLQTNVIGIQNQALHFFVPKGAYSGEIEVSILDENNEEIAYATAEEKFVYEKKVLVTTFLGETYENNTKYDIKDGPFGDCGGFERGEWLLFDPTNPDMLYVCGGSYSHRVIDFENEYVSTLSLATSGGQINSFGFTNGGDLIAVKDVSKDTSQGTFLFSAESGYKTLKMVLTNSRGNRMAICHPVTGNLYFSRYPNGGVYKFNPETDTKINTNNPEFTVSSSSVEIFGAMHPTGKYMYLLLRNKHVIMRSDYNEATDKFSIPYIVCGKSGTSGWVDAFGSNGRLYQPQQGCFVYNEEYAGKEDEYDFYFCDKLNHCIRKLTPSGKVSTYAGRPNGDGTAGFNDGDLRKEARFDAPAGITYDEKRHCLYVGDSNNHRIRRIGIED